MKKMKTKTTVNKLCVIVAAALSPTLVQAAPQFYGGLEMQTVDRKDSDLDSNVYMAMLGAKGGINIGEYGLSQAFYRMEVDLSNTANDNGGEGDIEVLQAMAALPTKIGTFAAGRMRSGSHVALVGPVDLFKTNSPNDHINPNSLFRQGAYSSRSFGYATPSLGGFKMVAGMVTASENNGEDVDATALRLDYQNQGFKASIGRTATDGSLWASDKDYLRYGVGIGYDKNNLHLGLAYESNRDDPLGDSDVMGVAASYKLDKLKFGLGYTIKDFEDAANPDDSLITMSVASELGENLSLWVEAGKYDIETKDNASVGFSFTF